MAISQYVGEVMDKKQLTTDVILLSFKVPESFTFEAGQYITFKLNRDGVTKPKSYSILSPPSQKGRVDLCIKLVSDGFASKIWEEIKVGMQLPFLGPLGHFVLDREAKEHWFLGAGTGVAPLYSMLGEFLAQRPQEKFHLIFGTKTQADRLFHEEFLSWQAQFPHFSYVLALSREKWSHQGHVQDHLGSDVQGKTFYICGLKELVLETRARLEQAGVDPKRIRFERYN